ncbi:phospholipid phosphatase 5 [Danaus plexippus]|uniref:Phosphatidic acid phosphatase n=1 Tax=Danaus plexippus plexippus TaxID=278856 RepID=A0A212END8_DANPL|nr:phospholipid phosphatase 5 [Danaus plexippus]OWR42989.1 Phosphatidic acid phosphatase [Danaus plexippus plexippus]
MPLMRSASYNLFMEISLRIILLSVFCYMESMSPFIRIIQPFELENNCKYPRHDSYVPSGMLWSIVLSVPCILSFIAWAVCNDCNDALEFLLAWSLSLGITGVTTDTVKLIVGRPRPDFFYRCFPDGVPTADLHCTGDPADVMEGRKSFPSGHSSMSFCSLGIASLWACGRLCTVSRRRGEGGRVILTLAPLMLAGCIALSRTCDYHHHWQDVLVGSVLGLSVSMFCYRQYYNPLTSELSGIPYIVTKSNTKYFNGKPESPMKDAKEESTPLLNGAKKEDKWI